MSAERSCELCGGRSQALLYEVDGSSVVRCRQCGLVFVGRPPSPEELIALYDENYWEAEEDPGYPSYLAAEGRKRHHYRGLLHQIERMVPPGEMLEIGSAYGYFLDEARRRGWKVRGVEPSAHAANHARDEFALEIAPGPFTEMTLEPESVDAVALWDVIEHLPDPRRTLESAHAWLRPGGVIALSTGDIRSLSARLHGPDWSLLTPPWHQFYFSRKTLRLLLEDVGFRDVGIGGDGVVGVDPGSAKPRIPRPLASLLQRAPITTLARKVGAGMIMFAFARKPAR